MAPGTDILNEADRIADVSEHLLVWCVHAVRGLARVEFVSELSRRRTVEELRRRLGEESIAFHEVELRRELAPTAMGRDFIRRLSQLPAGVVSVSGIEAIQAADEKLFGELLYVLNFRRDDIACLPLRQIWWMPIHVADAFMHCIPDLNSYFMLKLRLTEIVPLERAEFFSIPPDFADPSDDPREARRRAANLAERFTVALQRGEPPEAVIAQLAHPAIDYLLKANLEHEATALATRFNEQLSRHGHGANAIDASGETRLRRDLELAERAFGPKHPNTAGAANRLGDWLYQHARFAEAEPLMRRAVAIDEAAYGKDHPNLAAALNNLAGLLQATNRLKEAEPPLRRALAIDEAAFGPDHPKIAIRLNNLAQLLQDTNRLKEAEPLMRRALAIDEAAYGKDHPDVARDLNNLALLLQDTNRLKEAEPIIRRALAIDVAAYGKDHPEVATDLNNLAKLLHDTNRLKEAEPLMRRHLEIFLKFTAATNHEHPHLRAALQNYAALLEKMGRSPDEIQAQLAALTERSVIPASAPVPE